MAQMLCKEFYFQLWWSLCSEEQNWLSSFSRRPNKECHYKLYEMISNLDQHSEVHLLFKIYFI